ncbi:unnamed protein product [Tilletia laevis]|uniref:DNA-(apurinic or apyrimidinic site) lyase n=2 Tax=Tilletia TaxID=13289 RepID=A0A177V8X9_9BASI|nr:hypothetical protein CF336_g1416 [Tilletia laevis]KAE8264246.1 hypothetical protein A4X03_0g1091 [Tilletia caries]CAD6887681.1 unnamed protein product [Tilletia caries]CAD6937053.1 unnamed protein product [Tilletia caries]CAD6949594.1 unnamed protein product [Tilletia caries]
MTTPRPPSGYAAIKVSPSDVLLELTISNKCGQAFRWRSMQIWEPREPVPKEEFPQVKKEDGEEVSTGEDKKNGPEGIEEQTEWSLCLSDRVVLVRQDVECGYLYHRTLLPSPNRASGDLEPILAEPNSLAAQETTQWLTDYLSLRVPVAELSVHWSSRDPIFAKQNKKFTGFRMLRQDPWECLCAFICSSNNNIARIGQMVSKLCTAFTPPLLEYTWPAPPRPENAGLSSNEAEHATADLPVRLVYHPFPSAARLAESDVDQHLRELGFGYRAKYLANTASMLCAAHSRPEDPTKLSLDQYEALPASRLTLDGIVPRSNAVPASAEESRPRVKRRRTEPKELASAVDITPSGHSVSSYLASLRDMSYSTARENLIRLPGVGPKVADCVLLMSMDQPSSIPVDRHVFNFAEKLYGMRGASTRGHKGYEEVAEKLRAIWGGWAGWAHSVLFMAELRAFAKFEQPSIVKKEEDVDPALPVAKKPLLQHAKSSPAVVKLEAQLAQQPALNFSPTVNSSVKGTMPRTIVVVDGAGVQGAAVIEMLLNANLAVQKGTSQSSARGTQPGHAVPVHLPDILPSAPFQRFAAPGATSLGEAFQTLEDFEPHSLPRRPGRSLQVSESASCVSRSTDDHLRGASSGSSPDTSGKTNQDGTPPSSLPEDELVMAAADALTTAVGPNVLSAKPGYFASSLGQQPLPSSLSMSNSAAQPGTSELLSGFEMPSATSPYSDLFNATDVSSEYFNGHVPFSTPPTSPPQPPRVFSHESAEFSLKSLHATDAEAKSSTTSHGSVSSRSREGSDIEMFSPLAMSCIDAPSKSNRFKTPGTPPVWTLRSLMEGSAVDTAPQSTYGSKCVETMKVKYSDPTSMRNAMAGVHGLYLGLDAFSSAPQLFAEDNIKNIIYAAVSAGVQHVIFAGHVWDPDLDGLIISGNPKDSTDAEYTAGTNASTATSDEPGPHNLSSLPLAVQRCNAVHRLLRRLQQSGLFRLTVFSLPVCFEAGFEAGLLCEDSWFALRPKSNTYVLDMPVASSTLMPLCSLSDVGNAALQVFSRPERFDGVVLDLTSDIASPRELCVQMTQVIYVSGKRVIHCDDLANWICEHERAASAGNLDSQQNMMGSKVANSLLLREFILFMATFTRKPLPLLLSQVCTNARRYNLRLTPWREFAVNFCDDLLVAWR